MTRDQGATWQGSVEAIVGAGKIQHPEVRQSTASHQGVGGHHDKHISSRRRRTAWSSAFNVRPERATRALALAKASRFRTYEVI